MATMDLTREKYRAYIKVVDTVDGVDKFFIVGTKATGGTLAFGTTTETKTSITQKTSTNIAKKGAWSMPIATEIDLNDSVTKDLLIATVKQNINKLYDVLIVWEFITEHGVDTNVLAHAFKAIIPLTDLGGDGQATLATNFTISSSTDVEIGFVDTTENTGKYNAETDTYATDAFIPDPDGKKLLSIEYKATNPASNNGSKSKSTSNEA